MVEKNELRKQQKSLAEDLKVRALKAEKVLGEIAVHEAKIAELNETLAVVFEMGGQVAVVAPVAAKVPKAKRQGRKRRGGRKGPTQKDLVRDILKKAGRSMRIAEIVQAMTKAGEPLLSKHPLRAVEKVLYKNPKVFKKVSPGVFTV